MATTAQQDAEFKREVIADSLLELSIEWIAANLSPSDVFKEKELLEYAADGYSADEVFKQADLEDWAESNGYTKQ